MFCLSNFAKRLSYNLLFLKQKNREFHRLPNFAISPSAEAGIAEKSREQKKQVEMLTEMISFAEKGGGEAAQRRQREVHKKLLVRERLQLLLDRDGQFLEIGKLAGCKEGLPRAGCVIGLGSVSGRRCVIAVSDSTVKGGTMFPIGVKKQLRAQNLSKTLRLPMINVIDSGGAFLPLQAEIFPDKYHGGRTFRNQAVHAADGITQIAVVVGSCTAGAAYVPTMSDEAIICTGIGSVFLGGPPLVRTALGEKVTAEQLGGAVVHCRDSGCTDYFANDEQEAFEYCRDVVSTLPPSSCDSPNHNPFSNERKSSRRHLLGELSESASNSAQSLKSLAISCDDPSPNYIYQVLSACLDRSEFLEFRALYGSGLICGYGTIIGSKFGIVSAVGTGIDGKSAEKAAQLVQSCDERKLPILFLQRCLHEGWSVYDRAVDTIKPHAQLLQAIAVSRVPKVTINIGSTFGPDGYLTCGRAFGPVFYFSWPGAKIGYKNDDQTAEDSLTLASKLVIDDVILPENTRKVLVQVSPLLARRANSINISERQSTAKIFRF